ncbi:hypothetical protein, partial [Enterococcus faecalis]|uniref:hypothetical protein n=1 Tax=Enterococcus faecalis TaxID=1351 RepID=UPI003CC6A18D
TIKRGRTLKENERTASELSTIKERDNIMNNADPERQTLIAQLLLLVVLTFIKSIFRPAEN